VAPFSARFWEQLFAVASWVTWTIVIHGLIDALVEESRSTTGFLSRFQAELVQRPSADSPSAFRSNHAERDAVGNSDRIPFFVFPR
jgi:hypothetical protein